jgi:monoamine oxidase
MVKEGCEEVTVCVVGGGLAGLSCAAALQEVGLGVVLLEARDRLGGRVHTVPGPGGGLLELGAQWLHGGCKENSAWRLAGRLGLLGEQVGNTALGTGGPYVQ